MSELKTYFLGKNNGREFPVYLKSEADKVIAELKAQKAQAEDDCAYWKMSEGNAANAMHETEEYAMQLYKELRHSNHKRCLAMARWCEAEAQKCLTQQGAMIGFPWTDRFQYLQWQITHYSRWHRIWLKLAEKFKEHK